MRCCSKFYKNIYPLIVLRNTYKISNIQILIPKLKNVKWNTKYQSGDEKKFQNIESIELSFQDGRILDKLHLFTKLKNVSIEYMYNLNYEFLSIPHSYESLRLAFNQIADLTNLVKNIPTNLTSLNLNRNHIRDLGPLVQCLKSIKELKLSHNSLETIKPFIENPNNLEILTLNNNPIPGHEIASLIKISKSLKYLNINYTIWGGDHIDPIFEALKSSENLVSFYINHNFIKNISKLSNSKKLYLLDLSSNAIEDITSIIEILKQPNNLTYIDLSNNRINVKFMKPLIEILDSLKSKTLKINLANNTEIGNSYNHPNLILL